VFTLCPEDIAEEISSIRREVSSAELLDVADADYPFRLVSRRMKHVLNSLGTELPGLAAKGTTNPAFMNPDDLEDLGISEGDVIEITSPRSSILAVVTSAPDVRRSVISMAHSWGGSSLSDEKVRDIGSPTNRLVAVDKGHDRITGMVVQSALPVRVRLVERLTTI
jgi:anaerobic selenocysteine-containing dehydrogenase